MKQLVLIGYGAMAQVICKYLPENLTLAGVIASERSAARLREALPGVEVVTQFAELSVQPDLVIECGGQASVRQHGIAVVAAGLPLVVISSGALANDGFRQQLVQQAQQGGGEIHVPAGAIAGMETLAAARIAGIDRVEYTSRKPPQSWQGSLAEQAFDLAAISEPTVLFEGNARDAALGFPANANVAATIALAGIGFEATQVRLIADPTIQGNQHELTAWGDFGELDIRVLGKPLPDNRKTSALAALSLVRQCQNLNQCLKI